MLTRCSPLPGSILESQVMVLLLIQAGYKGVEEEGEWWARRPRAKLEVRSLPVSCLLDRRFIWSDWNKQHCRCDLILLMGYSLLLAPGNRVCMLKRVCLGACLCCLSVFRRQQQRNDKKHLAVFFTCYCFSFFLQLMPSSYSIAAFFPPPFYVSFFFFFFPFSTLSIGFWTFS